MGDTTERSGPTYDADLTPPQAWFDGSADARLGAVIAYHEALGGRHVEHVDLRMHARLHVAAEEQLQAGVPAVVACFERFEASGMVRHEIVHAVGTTFAEALRHALTSGQCDATAELSARLDGLQPAAWLARTVRARL